MSRRRATYEDLERLAENLVGEILDGELIASPRPASLHAHAALGVGGDLLFGFGRGPAAGWWILAEPELHLHGDVVVPDVAGWRRERLPVLQDVPAFELAPDWVCESLSPSTARYDRGRKMRIYGREKVRHYWLVDARQRTLEIFRLEPGGWTHVTTFEGDEKVRAEPFEAVELDLSQWWLPEAG